MGLISECGRDLAVHRRRCEAQGIALTIIWYTGPQLNYSPNLNHATVRVICTLQVSHGTSRGNNVFRFPVGSRGIAFDPIVNPMRNPMGINLRNLQTSGGDAHMPMATGEGWGLRYES